MITATGFASLLILPAFVFFACVVVCYVYWPELRTSEEEPVKAPPIDVDRIRRSAWKGYAGLLVEGIRPDLAIQVDSILRRADTCARIEGCEALAVSLYRQASAIVAAAYRHPSPRSFLSSYGY